MSENNPQNGGNRYWILLDNEIAPAYRKECLYQIFEENIVFDSSKAIGGRGENPSVISFILEDSTAGSEKWV